MEDIKFDDNRSYSMKSMFTDSLLEELQHPRKNHTKRIRPN